MSIFALLTIQGQQRLVIRGEVFLGRAKQPAMAPLNAAKCSPHSAARPSCFVNSVLNKDDGHGTPACGLNQPKRIAEQSVGFGNDASAHSVKSAALKIYDEE